jgi:drug/metabolite transporter (DMT)-like permease
LTLSAALQRRALAAGLLVVLLWGASFTIQKHAYSALGPGGFLFGRSLVMGSCALGLLWLKLGRPWPTLDRADTLALVRCTLAGQVLHILLITYGVHWSTAFSSALIFAMGPLITLLLLRLLGQARLQRNQVGGVVLACGGVLLFMAEKLLGSAWRAGGGDLVMLVGVAAFSLYTVWSTPLIARHGGLVVMCSCTVLATPLMLLLTAGAAWSAPWRNATAWGWASFFWTVLVSALLAWMLWGWTNAVRGVARTAPLLYLVPPVAGLVAWLTLGETFGPQKLLGATVALSGVVWAQWKPKPATVSTGASPGAPTSP